MFLYGHETVQCNKSISNTLQNVFNWTKVKMNWMPKLLLKHLWILLVWWDTHVILCNKRHWTELVCKKTADSCKIQAFPKLTICFHWSLAYLKTFIFSMKRAQKTFSTQGLMPGFQQKIRFDFKKLKRSFSAALTQSSLKSNLTTRKKNGIFRISSITNLCYSIWTSKTTQK